MSISFLYYNYCDLDSTTITASTENAFFPADNLQDPRSTKVYRSTASSASVVFDMGAASQIDTVAIVPHFTNGLGFTGDILLEANATNVWGAPSFTTTLTSGTDIDLEFEVAYKEFSVQNLRYWRVSAAGASYVELSRVYLGLRNTVGDRSINYGWKYKLDDNSKITKNLYGQRFSDQINRQKEFSFNFSNLDKTQVDDWFLINDYNGITKPMFMRIGCEGIVNNLFRFCGEVYLDAVPEITNSFYARYDLSVKVSEAL